MSELLYRVSAIIVVLLLLSFFVSSDEPDEGNNNSTQNVFKTSLNQQEVFYSDTFENNNGAVTFTTKTSHGIRHHYYGMPASNVSVLMIDTPAIGVDPIQPGEFRFKVSVGKSKSGETRLTVWEVKQ
ncbi:MAG: hypothetical protein K0U86_08855 [Planctomycetes bacterium]|nr:hypothetical protein [Planctomycetota bacterium]MCH9724997.1 hypothetical protein [Planctomycetota bacterium]MCH9777542.1 hypothetical protein [Planctomycetota bacterium]MCH9791526.1 hypothetical protein [Planctomycetota bacterium]MDF1742512.1 hypothetical protein [Gimesia sp.]